VLSAGYDEALMIPFDVNEFKSVLPLQNSNNNSGSILQVLGGALRKSFTDVGQRRSTDACVVVATDRTILKL
jgi:hypothetical protein